MTTEVGNIEVATDIDKGMPLIRDHSRASTIGIHLKKAANRS
jgi:hypothetical protein